jgi:hypothetical protein
MKKLFTLTLGAAMFVVAGPIAASAVPVPPPDEVPLEECLESMGWCPATYSVDDVTVHLPGIGSITGTLTCPLVAEITVTYTGVFIIGPWIIIVQAGWTICDYGVCGAYALMGGPN